MVTEGIWLLVLVLGLLGGILSGVPVYLAIAGLPLLIAGFASLVGAFDLSFLNAIPQRLFGIMGNSLLHSIPLFILMGTLLEQAGISERMLVNIHRFMGGTRSSITLSVLIVSTLIAAITGVIGATIAMLTLISLPAMLRLGVPQKTATGLICASGTLGQIIPPSIVLILLGDQISNAHQQAQHANGNFSPDPVSVGDLFAGALLPGLVLVALYGIYVTGLFHVGKGASLPRANPASEIHEDEISWPVLISSLKPVLLIITVLGSILSGIATPTEAATIGVLGAMLIAGRKIAVSIAPAFIATIRLTGIIFAIVIAASILSLVFRGFGGDELISEIFGNLPGGKWTMLIVAMMLIFVLGFVLEFIEIVLIVVPVMGPLLLAEGFDPVWLGVLIAVNLQTSFLTPPFGLALFYFRSAAPRSITTLDIYKAVTPFVLLQLVAMAFLILFPQLATWLPSLLY
jgi:tripartite ATP-independent transporter DctM subunit